MQAFSSIEQIQELAILSERIFSCADISDIGYIVVKEILKFIPANEVIVDVNSLDLRRPPLFSWNLNSEWASRYNSEFHHLNPTKGALQRLVGSGLPIVRKFEDLCREPLVETVFYRDYMKPQRHLHSLIGCQALQYHGNNSPNFQILLIRYDTEPTYSSLELATLQLLLPTMAQATMRIMKSNDTWAISVLRNSFGLSPKLAEVAGLIVNGFSNKEIAARLDITVGTSKHYAHQIFEITGTTTRSDLCRIVLG